MIVKHQLANYITEITSDPSSALRTIERKTYLQTLAPQMISGKVQGAFLSMVSHMVRPERVLEIGTFTGYGAICLASGLRPNGIVHTIEANLELRDTIIDNVALAGFEDQIECHFGRAEDIVPGFDEAFDLVFIDAGKRDYVPLYHLIFDLIKVGGFILADNTLWAGKVIDPNPDLDTRAILDFNNMVQQDVRVDNVLLPLVDGMMICRKK